MRNSIRETVRQAFITGTALTIPFIITLIVLGFVLDFVSRTLNPVVDLVNYYSIETFPELLIEASTVLTLVAVVLVIGLVAEHTPGERLAGVFHGVMESIPGVSSVYNSFRRMSDVLLENDTDSFQEVKLVEFPHEGTYALGYVTGTPSPAVREAAGYEDMTTLFVPLAPNPVMGGYLVYLPDEHIHDVDMTVEESIQAIVTSGVATSATVDDER
ncbi:DUF502 domain-containing protein [Halegenticoccus soli]|uniref:DUF502 domain-containing protein n=1 Tax=Halegenticoccus soli TaxID=1985678 RepID=UPI000C6CED18|nr:DUF502 domain-containing protein [Halegenticoccus soli]